MSRISLVSKDNASPEVQEIFTKLENGGVKILNLYRVLGHNASLMRDFLRLGNSLLLRSGLSPKLRELAIMRVAILTRSKYEWAQHHAIALESGVTRQQIGALSNWSYSNNFDEQEKAVLLYTDEVAQKIDVKHDTFAALKKHLDERNILELTLTVGYWLMVARLLIPLQVDVDKEVAGSSEELTGRKGA
ncbi:MAG: carboxymuconolactone decarboxylase family protein [Chloroflexi bacterium]|nr:carboxymuconolactone decarboxylase family protein [Chloroflexota bacterium]